VKTKPIQSQTKPIHRPLAGNPKHEVRNPKRFERVRLKKQNQSRPLAGNPKHEVRNPKRFERVRLKKQSQFAGGEIGDNSLLVRSYGDLRAGGGKKTKPIQSQTKPI